MSGIARHLRPRLRRCRSARRRGDLLPRLAATALAMAMLGILGGCASHTRRVREAHELFYRGNLSEAEECLSEQLAGAGRRAPVLRLDRATVQLAAGETDQAERAFRQLRDELERSQGEDAGEFVASLASDDAVRSYAGPGYEQVMVRIMLSLTSLLGDGMDAESYALQAQEKQAELARAAAERGITGSLREFQPLAFAPYLRGVLREATWHDYDDAERAYQQVSHLQPRLTAAASDLQRVRSGVHSAPGHGVVYVIGLVGRGPVRVETTAEVTSGALLIADRIVSATGPYTVPPTVAPVKVPGIFLPPSPAQAVLISVDGQPAGATELVTDVGQLARDTWEAERPWVVGRAVARRVVKKATVVAIKDSLGIHSAGGQLLADLAGVAWEATERCDTRCWGVLPREIQVRRLEMPAGRHTIELATRCSDGRPPARPLRREIVVQDGGNTYLLAFAPDRAVVAAPASRAAAHPSRAHFSQSASERRGVGSFNSGAKSAIAASVSVTSPSSSTP